MAEPVAALAGLAATPGSGNVTLSEASLDAIAQVQAWPDTIDGVEAAIPGVLFSDTPPLGHLAGTGAVVAAHVAPGRFILASGSGGLLASLRDAIPAPLGTVTDLSHGRVMLVLEGAAAEAVLQSCVAINLAALPPGRVAATMIHHVDVLILRLSKTEFRLLALRSFAQSLAEWLLDAGLEEGIGFRPR